jgi:hypothetical protein
VGIYGPYCHCDQSSHIASYLIQLFISPIWNLTYCPIYIGYLHKVNQVGSPQIAIKESFVDWGLISIYEFHIPKYVFKFHLSEGYSHFLVCH